MPPPIQAPLGSGLVEDKLPICGEVNNLDGSNSVYRYVRERLTVSPFIFLSFHVTVPTPLVVKPEAMPPTLCYCDVYVPAMNTDSSGGISIMHLLLRTMVRLSDVMVAKLGLFKSATKAIKA